MPVGYPRTPSGVEFKLLEKMFTPRQAQAALAMDHTFRTAESLYSRSDASQFSENELEKILNEMTTAGNILSKHEGDEKRYALIPFVVGMYEFQTAYMTREFYQDAVTYLKQGYAIDYLTTGVPQMRVIPIEKSLSPEIKINSYDEIRKIIMNADKGLSVTDCICKKAQGLDGEPCRQSDTNEVCIALHDYHDTYTREGWGRSITKDEALAIIEKAEKNGLVIQTANEQDPQFICACCSCCCGILKMMKSFSRPGDFAATNYYAEIDSESCIGCGVCVKRCNLEAIKIIDKKAILSAGKCIGCGLCVSTCKPGSIRLVNTEVLTVPPRDTVDLYDTIKRTKRSRLRRVITMIRALMGVPVKN